MAATITSGTGSTSSSLIQRIQAHDALAWRRFVDLYSPLVDSWCRRAGLQAPDAADVLQETFQAVAAGIRSFQHGGPGQTFRGRLWTVARNKLRDYFRRRNIQPQALGGTAGDLELRRLISAADSPTDSLTASASPLFARALELVRAEFEPPTWDAFWRTTVDGQATDRVAADLGRRLQGQITRVGPSAARAGRLARPASIKVVADSRVLESRAGDAPRRH